MSRIGPPMSVTSAVIEAARGWSRLPPGPSRVVGHLLRDGVAVLLAGMTHPTVQTLVAHARELGCAPRSTLIGTGLATAPQEAAFVHGTAMHVLDFEPMFLPPTHAVSPVLGSLLALVEAEPGQGDGDGERFLGALAVGLQLQADLRRAAGLADRTAATAGRHFPFQRQGFHPPGTVGPMGAALACAMWLRLPPREVAMALGIAASRAGAVCANIGTMTKATHCGHAARVGVEAALLARRGMTASAGILDAPSGWGEVFGGPGFDVESLVVGMRTLRCFSDPGFAFKRWPAHTAMQVAIQAGLEARGAGGSVGHVEIRAPRMPYCDRPAPADSDAARFSFQYNVAVALLDGEVDFSTHTAARLRAPDLQALLGRTRLVLDPGIPTCFDGMTVTVSVDDGREATADRWAGHWREPASEDLLAEKFLRCAQRVVSAEDADALHAAVNGVGAPGGLRTLLDGLAATPIIGEPG